MKTLTEIKALQTLENNIVEVRLTQVLDIINTINKTELSKKSAKIYSILKTSVINAVKAHDLLMNNSD